MKIISRKQTLQTAFIFVLILLVTGCKSYWFIMGLEIVGLGGEISSKSILVFVHGEEIFVDALVFTPIYGANSENFNNPFATESLSVKLVE